MKLYKPIRDIVSYSLIAGALLFGGCTANKLFIPETKPAHSSERDDIFYILGNLNPSKKDYERLNDLIKNSRENKKEIVSYVYRNLKNIPFDNKIRKLCAGIDSMYLKEDSREKTGKYSDYEKQIINSVFVLKSMVETDPKKAISYLDTAIAIYPFNQQPYYMRSDLKYGICDLTFDWDFDLGTILSYINLNMERGRKAGKDKFLPYIKRSYTER